MAKNPCNFVSHRCQLEVNIKLLTRSISSFAFNRSAQFVESRSYFPVNETELYISIAWHPPGFKQIMQRDLNIVAFMDSPDQFPNINVPVVSVLVVDSNVRLQLIVINRDY